MGAREVRYPFACSDVLQPSFWRRANLVTPVVRRKRHPYARLQFTDIQLPDLVEIQRNSFNRFLEEGISRTFAEISPIEDYTGSYAVEFRSEERRVGKERISRWSPYH